MKTALFCSMIVLGVMPLAASAEEVSSSFSWGAVTFQPRAYMGYADFSIEQSRLNELVQVDLASLVATGVDKIQTEGFLGGLGVTIAVGRFFSDFYYQSTLDNTADSGGEQQNQLPIENPSIITRYLSKTKLQHEDWALSFGYMITNQWSVFAGYKAGDTEWSQAFQDDWGGDYRSNVKITGKFEQDGPFVGTSYSFPIGPGALTLKAAYAYLNGTVNNGSDSFSTN